MADGGKKKSVAIMNIKKLKMAGSFLFF